MQTYSGAGPTESDSRLEEQSFTAITMSWLNPYGLDISDRSADPTHVPYRIGSMIRKAAFEYSARIEVSRCAIKLAGSERSRTLQSSSECGNCGDEFPAATSGSVLSFSKQKVAKLSPPGRSTRAVSPTKFATSFGIMWV